MRLHCLPKQGRYQVGDLFFSILFLFQLHGSPKFHCIKKLPNFPKGAAYTKIEAFILEIAIKTLGVQIV